jgi:HD-like signal output (HDOD) protein
MSGVLPEDALPRYVLHDLVSTTGDLAALPSTVVRLLDLLKDQTCAADKVVQVLDRDGAMTANVLKLSNSAFYGVRGTVATTRQALVLLGNRAVLTLAFATGMVPVMRRNLTGYGIERDRYWEHSLTSAMAAGVVMTRLDGPDRACEAFTAGLVHDIGMLALDAHLATNGMKLVPAFPLFNVSERERQALGFDHTDAGALLAGNWGFPAALGAAVAHHHHPWSAPVEQDLVAAVMVGDMVAQMASDRLQPEAWPEQLEYLASRGIDGDYLRELVESVTLAPEETLARATRPAGTPCPSSTPVSIS